MAGTVKVFGNYSDIKSIKTGSTSINTSVLTLDFTPIDNTSFKLKWNQIVGATEYVVYRHTENDEENPEEYARTIYLDYQVVVNDLNEKFYYYVKPITVASNEIKSNVILAGAIPSPVTNVIISANYNSAKLTWQSTEEVDSFEIYMSSNPYILGDKIGTTITNEFNTGSILNFGHMYYFSIIPVSKIGITLGQKSLPQKHFVQAQLNTINSIDLVYISDNSINLSWEEVDGAEGYEIYYAYDEYPYYYYHSTTNSSDLIINNLFQDQVYHFKIRSFKFIGISKVYSEFSSLESTMTPIHKPTFEVSHGINGEIKLSWFTQESVTAYEIYLDGILFTTIENSSGISLSKVLTGVEVGKLYNINLVAINETNRSNFSETISAKAYPEEVLDFRITDTTYNSISLAWSASIGAHHYQIYMGTSPSSFSVNLGTVEGLSFTVNSNLKVNQTYYFTVIPKTEENEGNSWPVIINGTTKMDLVENLTITPIDQDDVILNWDPIEGATGYIVKRNIVNGSSNAYEILGNSYEFHAYSTDYQTQQTFSVQPFILQDNVKKLGEIISSDVYSYTKVTRVDLIESSKVLEIGDSFSLNAQVNPLNSTFKELTYTSSDTSVVTVDSNGIVHAIRQGLAKITVKSKDGISSICEISVPLTFSGVGNATFTNLDLNNGASYRVYKVVANHNGDGSFVVNSYKNIDKIKKTIFNENGNYSGSNILYDGLNTEMTSVDLEILTDDEWSISIYPIIGTTTTNMQGIGDTVTKWFIGTGGPSNIDLNYFGDDEFTFWLLYNGGNKTELANGVGNYSSQVNFPNYMGMKFAIIIEGSGTWEVDLNRGDPLTTY